MGTLNKDQLHNFLQKINKTDDCWLWVGAIKSGGRGGYGCFRVGTKILMAHRVSYEHFVGLIPDNKVLDHKCRVRHCVNPSHLEPVSQKENSQRGLTGVHNKNKTHCANGHLFSFENTYIDPLGYRECRTCRKETKKRFLEKNKYENS